jgi:TRAP transporter TAXI family solute receptor
VAQATQGSVENLRLVGTGQLESGIAQSDIVRWAYGGSSVFAADGPMKQLRAIASLFPESLQIVVRADSPIRTLADLKGRRISLGETESGTLVDARIVLAASGLAETDLIPEYLRSSTAAANLRDGTLDGFFLIGGVPAPAVRELASTAPIRLVPIDDEVLSRMREEYGLYRRSVIPAGTYPGLDVETPSIGFHALWVVSANASEDLIYAITKALWSEATRRLLDAQDPIGKSVRLQGALDGLSVPLHPGARRFYREAGLNVEGDGPPSQRN